MKSLYEIRLISKSEKPSDAIQELSIYLKSFPNDVDAWLLMAELVETNEQELFCYRHALKIDLNNQIAQSGIRRLVAVEDHKPTEKEHKPFSIQTKQLEPTISDGPISKHIKARKENEPQLQASPIDLSIKPSQYVATKTDRKPETDSKNQNIGFIIVIIVIILMLIGIFSSSNETSTSSSPRELTTQEKDALKAVQEQDTIIANNMHESIAFILVLLEADGHITSIDGWYAGSSDGHTFVYFYFYLDGNREYAEWWYYPNGRIDAKNDWAFAFMGE